MIASNIQKEFMEIGLGHWNGHVRIAFECGTSVTLFLEPKKKTPDKTDSEE